MASSPRWSGPQRRIGLTGGIASGKSTVARWLAEQGLPVLDADVYAREALAPGSAGAQAVIARYGEVVQIAGSTSAAVVIDRAALGRIVFRDPLERQWLEKLVHPRVRERFDAELAALQAAPAVVLVIPLLFEAGLEPICSEVWLVDCAPEQQLQRLMARDGLSAEEAQARIEAQWPLERKRSLSDHIIDNRGNTEGLNQQLRQLFNTALEHL
jgi:dephospho-CoA kinase